TVTSSPALAPCSMSLRYIFTLGILPSSRRGTRLPLLLEPPTLELLDGHAPVVGPPLDELGRGVALGVCHRAGEDRLGARLGAAAQEVEAEFLLRRAHLRLQIVLVVPAHLPPLTSRRGEDDASHRRAADRPSRTRGSGRPDVGRR